MKKTILLYGVLGGLLIALLKLVEYRFLVIEHSLEIYGGIVALLFSVLGIWLGLKLTRTRETVVVREVPVRVEIPVPSNGPFVPNAARQEELGITRRELEILQLIAAGLSNREIAEELVVAERTVHAHVGNILGKLHLADRTEAAVFAWREGLVRRPGA